MRRRKFLSNATSEFSRMIGETREQIREEHKSIALSHYNKLAKERQELWDRGEEQASKLRETLIAIQALDGPLAVEARGAFGVEGSNQIAQNPAGLKIRNWLQTRFARYLR